MKNAHTNRIHQELIAAGITKYGLSKMAIKELPRIIHKDEHIGGIVYGPMGGSSTALMVATDKRIIFIDRHILFMTTDELTYEVVSGIKINSAGPFTTITLHTRVTDYCLRHVNAKCAHIFSEFIEKKRLESTDPAPKHKKKDSQLAKAVFEEKNTKAGIAFLKANDIGVLSTVDRTGTVHGAVINYLVDQNDFIYILTKSDTQKGRNVYAHSQVALTVHEPGTFKTLQLHGNASVETNQETKNQVIALISKARKLNDKAYLPPVTQIRDGSFMVIKIQPTNIKFNDYTQNNS